MDAFGTDELVDPEVDFDAAASPPPDMSDDVTSAFEADAVLLEQPGDENASDTLADEPWANQVNGADEELPPARHSPTLATPRPEVEHETIKAWREDQKQRLADKDEAEATAMEQLKAQAKGELEDWYKKYTDHLGQTQSDNRSSEKNFVAEMNDITPGTEWERIHKLCDFNQKTNRNQKDTSRLRSILLQLKQNPREISAN